MQCTGCHALLQTADLERCPYCQTPVAPPSDPLLGRILLNQYLIQKKLSQGTYGAVYEAQDLVIFKRPVAVKVLHRRYLDKPSVVQRFFHEALAAGRLEHPSAIKIYNVGSTEDGFPWIAMELLSGPNLEARLHSGWLLPCFELLKVFGPLCAVLSEAHAKGIIHRDLKPQNIMLVTLHSGEILPKVLDFGIAGVRDAPMGGHSLIVSGTPAYMPPEQWKGLTFTDARSDLYALGTIAYQCLSGRLPFQAENAAAWMNQHCFHEPIDLEEAMSGRPLPRRLRDVVMRTLKKDPQERFQSIADFKIALERALQEPPKHPAIQTISPKITPGRYLFPYQKKEPYFLCNELGTGSFGASYLALQPKTKNEVVVKVLHKHLKKTPASLERFQKNVSRKLSHPNAVEVFDLGEAPDGSLWIAMERVKGTSLDALLAKGPLSEQELISILVPLCELLSTAHAASIFHHNVKPPNILLVPTSEGKYTPRLPDLGVASLLQDPSDKARLSLSSAAYLSPEECMGRGKTPADGRADIYALGLISYLCLSGQLPFQGEDALGWIQLHLGEDPMPIEEATKGRKLSSGMITLIKTALEKRPQDRFQTAEEMKRALLDVLKDVMEPESGYSPTLYLE